MPATATNDDIEVDVPDVGTVSFPSSMSEQEIEGALAKHFPKPPSLASRALAGFEKLTNPSAPSSGDMTVFPKAGNQALQTTLGKVQSGISRVGSELINLPVELWNADTMSDVPLPATPGKPIINLPPWYARAQMSGGASIPLELMGIKPPAPVEGLSRSLAKAESGFTEPGNAIMLPFAAAKPIQVLFGAQMAAQTPEAVQQAIATIKDPNATTAQKWEAGGDAFAQLAMLTGIALHMKPEQVKATMTPEEAARTQQAAQTLPKTAEAVANVKPTTTGEPNAIHTESTPILRGVRQEPVQDVGQVPTEGSSGKADVGGSQTTGARPETLQETLTPAYRDNGGVIHTGPDHTAILKRLGVTGFDTPESRETPQFGFVDKDGKWVTRPEAQKILGTEGPAHSSDLTKQAWQMTQSEFRKEIQARQGPKGQRDYTYFGVDDASVGKIMDWWKEHDRLLGTRTGREILDDPFGHRKIVESAIAEGKPVPPEVLADYPDLKPKPLNPGGSHQDLPEELQKKHEENVNPMKAQLEALRAQAAQKYKFGPSPANWTIVEHLEPDAIEKAEGTQPVRVKNEQTGETQVTKMSELIPRKPAEPKPAKAAKVSLDAQLREVKLDPSSFPNKESKLAALKRAKTLTQTRTEKPIPMGGATPEEFEKSPTTPTGIKNATVDQERESRGLPPAIEPARRSFGRVWDEAMAIVDHDPATQDNLIDELRDKPRALTDTEDALLLHRQIDLQNEYGKATRDLAQAHDDGRLEDVEREKMRVAGLSDRLLDLYNINKAVGTETGRGLNARKMMAYEDFSLAKMELDKRAAKGGAPLTDAERQDIQKLHDRINTLQKQLDEHEAAAASRKADTASEQAVKDINAEVETERKQSKKGSTPDTPEDVAKRIKARADAGSTPPELTGLIQKLAKAFVRRGIKERVPLVDAVHDVIKGIFPAMDWRQTMDAISGYGDFKQLSKDQIAVQLRDLKGQMQQASKLLDMFEKEPPSKTGFERRTPSDTERRMIQQVNEAKKRFGINTTDPAAQLKTALASLKTRLRNQIADYEEQIASKEKFVKEHAPVPEDAESKALLEQRDKLKAEFDQIFGEREISDEQRVKNALASLDRQSAEIERQLKEGDIFRGKQPSKTPSTPELEAARAKRDALKLEREYLRESIQPTPRSTPEERSLKALKTRLANRTVELRDKLAKGDFSKRPRPTVQLDAEAMRLKAENQKAKDEFHQGLLRDRLARRTPFEKMQDTLVKWRRNFLLSGPVTLAKLTSAAAQRITTTPMEETVGTGLKSAFPRLAERTTRQQGLNSRAEAKAFTEGFTKGMSDAWQTLKTGKSDLDRAYGPNNQLPREAIDFLGSIHGALKTVAKRNEFARSLELRASKAIEQGLDITDAMVQSRLALEAYRDANRSIFMQDNRVVSAYKAGIARLLQPEKSTGQVPTSRKVIATGLNVALPIVKIPSNIVAETMEYATGSVTGSFKLANAYRKGIDNLPPEQADIIMRQLKKGSLGAAAMLIGYFNPQAVGGYYQPGQKRNPKDVPVGGMRLFGVTIPNYLLHSPFLETFQMGATIRRVADSKLHKKDTETQGIPAGIIAGGLGLLDEVPFVQDMTEWVKALNPQERGAFEGELAKSIIIPAGVQWLAKRMDKDKQGNVVNRQPKTAWQHFETGIPGLRKNVPINRKQPTFP